MFLRRLVCVLSLVAVTAFVTNDVISREHDAPDRVQPDQTPKPDAARDTESLIETMVRHAMPAEQHRLLDRMVGRWKTAVKYRMTADAPVVESEGTCRRKWILGNRFVLSEFDGGDLALPFQAIAIYGYDRFEEKYTSAWVDSLSTAITTYLGTCEEPCDVINFIGRHGDPWTGTKRQSRGVTRFLSDDKHVLALYESGRDGREYKVLEIVYTRE